MDIRDDKLRSLLGSTKIEASENLKFRIMHQIEAEKLLIRKKDKRARSIWGNFSILGIMYAIIAAIGVIVYFVDGESALNTSVFFIPVLFISAICGMFFLISTFDDRRQNKKHSSD